MPPAARGLRRLDVGPSILNDGVMQGQPGIADRFYTGGLLPRAISVRDVLWSKPADQR